MLRPLPKAMQGVACEACDKRQAVWEHTKTIRDRKGECVCSLCWLYSSGWTEGTADELDVLIQRVEDKMSVQFRRDEDGHLAVCADADRILGAIVMSSRLFLLRGKTTWQQTDM